jgi:hypothetical protein
VAKAALVMASTFLRRLCRSPSGGCRGAIVAYSVDGSGGAKARNCAC